MLTKNDSSSFYCKKTKNSIVKNKFEKSARFIMMCSFCACFTNFSLVKLIKESLVIKSLKLMNQIATLLQVWHKSDLCQNGVVNLRTRSIMTKLGD